jgi:hypothetical protein
LQFGWIGLHGRPSDSTLEQLKKFVNRSMVVEKKLTLITLLTLLVIQNG